jgi:N-acetylglucosaminyl-diphospho-decaprenol L-rhamnosyltransferase
LTPSSNIEGYADIKLSDERELVDAHSRCDITIIIVSYNTQAMTLECIRSVLEQTSVARCEVIVVDNASKDGSADAIRRNFPDIKLIASAENLGFARANNLAARHAHGSRLLLLNPDTVILDHAIDRLHEFATENPSCRIWGGRTLFADGSLNPTSCWRHATLWSIFCFAAGLTKLKRNVFNPEAYGRWQRDSVREVDIVTGCFLLIDRQLWQQLEGFDPAFFMYAEEADLCLRARKLGARPTITPTATIIHHGHASEPHQAEQRIKVLAGRITLMRRHGSPWTVFAGRLLYLMLPLTRLFFYGTFATLSGRPELRRTANNWRHVWQSRQRWINGWNDVALDSARGGAHGNFPAPQAVDQKSFETTSH